MQGANLLIVDDDEDDYLIVRSLLDDISRGPYRLDWASTYEEGERYFRENRHSLCLMDYRLGVRDGIELLKRSGDLGFSGPIIMLTGMHKGEVDMRALEAGAVDYLAKDGLTAEQLARSIRYALARREMEQERVERLRAESENRSKSEFLAHLSHELRTPLSAILGFTELLMTNIQNEENLSHLNIVHRNGKHLLGLLNDVLDLSKIEAGKLEMEIQPVHFIPLLTDIYALMSASAQDKNLTFELIPKSALPEIIHTDPTRLRQILLNLVGNAIKFTSEGGVQLSVGIDRPGGGTKRLWFCVKDTGIGISPEYLEPIFDPFMQIKSARAQTRTGTGLGLAISKQLVERLGGNISVESVENQGSQFHFYINPGDIERTPVQEFSFNYPPSVETMANLPRFCGRVLVVDDLRDIRILIGHYVTRCGLEVGYAGDGAEAIAAVEKQAAAGRPFDLIFMDIHMPVLDGIEAARELRTRGHMCPLVALTAAHMKGDRERYLKAGFTDCLSKPIDQHRMISCLSTFLDAEQDSQREYISPPPDGIDNILVVEDSKDALEATCAILSLQGWNPLRAQSGEQAIKVAQGKMLRAALVDLNLPDMSGYDLTEKLHQITPQAEIIIVSGQPVETELLKTNVKNVLLKPVTLDSLIRVLN